MAISTGAIAAANSAQSVGGKVQSTIFKTANPVAKAVPTTKTVFDARESSVDKPASTLVQQSLDDINKLMAGFSISVQFQIDPDYKELIVEVVDQDTGKLIRQIPTEEVVRMSKAMDSLKGLLFAQSA